MKQAVKAVRVKQAVKAVREGDRGSGLPLKNHKTIGFSSNTGTDPLKYQKVTKPALKVGPSLVRQRNAI